MNENLKEKLNIFIRCIIYMLVMSYTFCSEKDTIFVFIFFAKIFLDAILIDTIFLPFDNLITFSDESTNFSWMLIAAYNLLFLPYLYAKICGLYKKLQKYNFWVKGLIFLAISILAYLISRYDFKDLKLVEADSGTYWWIYAGSILSAFLLNIFFNFLTKKFPKPFEKIGYICSIEFFKDIVGKFKKAN